MQQLISAVEALIFSSQNSISAEELRLSIELATSATVSADEIKAAIAELLLKYNEDETKSFEVVFLSGGYRFMTKPAFQHFVGAHEK